MTRIRAAVAVAGGGPAGSALARRLALLGHHVVLIERDPRSRRNIAESLAPGVRVHLSTLGIDAPPGRICTKRIVRWRGQTESIEDGSLIVDRGAFDAHLLHAAESAGVRVLHATVTAAERRDGRWILTAGDTTIDAAFLADTTGRAGLLRRPRRYAQPRTFALRARWSSVDTDDAMRICVFPEGWMWGARADDGSYHAALFVDRECAPLRDDVLALLAQAEPFAFLARGPDVCHVCDATPYVVDEPIQSDAILAGDAACAIDPLSSSGVQAALGGAISASIAVNTILRAPERMDAAIAFYKAHVQSAAARHDRWRSTHYASADTSGAFWRARAADVAPQTDPPLLPPDAPVAIHPSAALIDGPVVAGDLIETRRVLRTPSGEHVAFVGGIDVAPLVEAFRDGMSAAQLARSWPLAPRQAIGVMRWLVANGTVIPRVSRGAREGGA